MRLAAVAAPAVPEAFDKRTRGGPPFSAFAEALEASFVVYCVANL